MRYFFTTYALCSETNVLLLSDLSSRLSVGVQSKLHSCSKHLAQHHTITRLSGNLSAVKWALQ